MTRQPEVEIIPLTLRTANDMVRRIHRHHAPIPPGFPWFCVGAVAEGQLVGVAIAGRPTNRNNDDRRTVEVLRVATNGAPNAGSALMGACARAAKAIGARRIITYTLESESGVSLRASGWDREADGIESAWAMGKSRTRAIDRPHMREKKVRWAKHFTVRDGAWAPLSDEAPAATQGDLFGGAA